MVSSKEIIIDNVIKKEDQCARKVRLSFEGKKIKSWLDELGYTFTEACIATAKADGFFLSCGIYFASNCGDICNERNLNSLLQEFVRYKWLRKTKPAEDAYFDECYSLPF